MTHQVSFLSHPIQYQSYAAFRCRLSASSAPSSPDADSPAPLLSCSAVRSSARRERCSPARLTVTVAPGSAVSVSAGRASFCRAGAVGNCPRRPFFGDEARLARRLAGPDSGKNGEPRSASVGPVERPSAGGCPELAGRRSRQRLMRDCFEW